MKKIIRMAVTGMALLSMIATTASAQALKIPAPSPTSTLKQNFGLGEVTIEYSRPGVKGRTIFGDVVPFGKIWRTGANATTKVTFSDDVKLEGNAVAAGTYGLYTIPNKDSWDIMLYKDLTLGGNVADYKSENEVLRFKVKPQSIAGKVETFTINMADVTASKANIQLQWDKTQVDIAVTTDVDTKVMKNIETALSPDDKRPYFQAATYYYENDKDMNKALEWANKAIDQNKAFYVVHLKAKIQMKLKDYKGAAATAEQSMALAKEAKNDDYVRMNEKIIADAKKMK
ncbi:MAG TPA: DUF2911 domain-containing protein [Bacteroidia bacterium]|jgi:nitrous oxide reductase accessory protein NosL|nr:DUF2911 domain-containing protein [Bacteroidia bacterium]